MRMAEDFPDVAEVAVVVGASAALVVDGAGATAVDAVRNRGYAPAVGAGLSG